MRGGGSLERLRPLMAAAAALAGAAVSGRPARSGVALVTGSTDGIGKLTARLLAQQEFTVLLHGRSQQRLDTAREEILAAVPAAQIETYCHDLSLLGGAEALAAEVLGKHSSLDVVVQNAGVFMQSRVVTSDELEITFDVNVAAPFILSKRLSPALQPGSRMLMVSSISQSDGGELDLSSVQRRLRTLIAEVSPPYSTSHEATKLSTPTWSLRRTSRKPKDCCTTSLPRVTLRRNRLHSPVPRPCLQLQQPVPDPLREQAEDQALPARTSLSPKPRQTRPKPAPVANQLADPPSP